MDSAADELYGLPPEEFTGARDERVRAAREAGDRKLAAALGKLRRPTVSAWVLNLLIRDQPEVAEQLVELGAELRRAQEQLSGPALRELATQRQRLVSALVRSARKLAAEAGHPVSAATGFELEQTLHAALADPDVAAEVGSGRLAKPASRTGFEAEAPPKPERLAPVRQLRAVRDDERAEDPAVVRERRRRELERERLQTELAEAEQARDRAGGGADRGGAGAGHRRAAPDGDRADGRGPADPARRGRGRRAGRAARRAGGAADPGRDRPAPGRGRPQGHRPGRPPHRPHPLTRAPRPADLGQVNVVATREALTQTKIGVRGRRFRAGGARPR